MVVRVIEGRVTWAIVGPYMVYGIRGRDEATLHALAVLVVERTISTHAAQWVIALPLLSVACPACVVATLMG